MKLREFTGFIKKKYPQVIAVYLHGSRVKGYAVKDSDTDVAVIVDKNSNSLDDELTIMSEVAGNLSIVNPDVRVVDRQSSPVFLFNVIRDGELIYERSGADRVNFETEAIKTYFDTAHIRQIYREYLYKQVKEEAHGYK